MLSTAYRLHFGWTVADREKIPHLVLGHNMVGLATPPAEGGAVLGYLQRHDLAGPVLEPEMGTWVFLADANGLVVNPAELPADVRLLGCGTTLPVPMTAQGGAARWVVAPDVKQRWLPSLAAIVAAVRATARLRGQL
ncbi:hypothetical protein HFP15_19150 [Amycolatopsis sp. K13G38]|uniref:Uncharacterized protein n=1 Tax=Amycolatopsis acididurans TaxID=2724524 RepID=A0ABX1J5H8_9PSEU|nr:hypothetical protein [Amycolatopsis acididurans]NKQ55003.1 hypothetical protein [Amycolatopsis acididurans]